MAALVAGGMALSSCGDDFLSPSPTEKAATGTAATEGTINLALTSAYQILLFDTYANNNYNGVLLMSDLRSDDIYKGGSDAGDQGQLYSLSQFNLSPNEGFGLWNIYYSGLARTNNAIIACGDASGVDADNLKRLNAEAHLLRAYYLHLLWKFYGNVVFFSEPIEPVNGTYVAPQYTADDIYKQIIADLEVACEEGALPMKTNSGSSMGRVNRAMALMLKARVVMYQKDSSRYAEITKDMAEIIKSGEYSLVQAADHKEDGLDWMWLNEGEFNGESIFETNQAPTGKTWSSGWQGFGTNLPAFISPADLAPTSDEKADIAAFQFRADGWGFGPVRKSAYDMYEDGDLRRDASIADWGTAAEDGIVKYVKRFQDTGYFQKKYAARKGYAELPGDQALNFCNNLRLFRYAETLLNYAELVNMFGQSEVDGVSAQSCFDQIRDRAFGDTSHRIALNADNIKLERRREFFGEGMRFWDLVRWGDAAKVLTENDPDHSSVRTFTEDKKYMPIPQTDIDNTKGSAYELKQNPGY